VSDDKAREAARAGKRVLGGLLMAVGAMVALLCGLCTLGVSILFLSDPHPSAMSLIVPLVIGGVPTTVGVGVFWIGLAIFRDGRSPRVDPSRAFE